MKLINATHDPTLRSWVESANVPGTDFPIQNLPFGVFRRRGVDEVPRVGVAIGDQILDLARYRQAGLFEGLAGDLQDAATAPVLNSLMALGEPAVSQLRARLVRLLKADGRAAEPDGPGVPAPRSALVPMIEAELRPPAAIGDYTDFYASIDHATRVGRLFRPDNPLLPNYKYMPIAYHGRSSSIVVSGTPIRRPYGQAKPPDSQLPTFSPSRRLDYELEVGAFVGVGNNLGQPVSMDEAESRIFGLCLLNDWSARDLQAWEYQPLGPFVAKNFATTVSPWVVTREALAPYRCPAFVRAPDDPRPMPYLFSERNEAAGGFDLTLEVCLTSERMRRDGQAPMCLSCSSFRNMYWTIGQMVAHHTSNGCNLRPGDLLGSGTVSGPNDGSEGCLLEMTRQGARPIELPTGETRSFLEDGDEVILRAYGEREGFVRIGFGECRGMIVPALADGTG